MIQEIQNYARTSMRLVVEELTGFADDGKYSARLNVSLKLLLLKNCFKTEFTMFHIIHFKIIYINFIKNFVFV